MGFHRISGGRGLEPPSLGPTARIVPVCNMEATGYITTATTREINNHGLMRYLFMNIACKELQHFL
jgi:hypothetical protein